MKLAPHALRATRQEKVLKHWFSPAEQWWVIEGDLVAWNQALTTDMVLSQPVIYEIDKIKVPTLLLIGMKDTTALGKDRAPPEAAETLGNYAALAPAVAARIKGSSLIAFDDLGQEISRRHGHAAHEHALLVDADLLHLLARNQEDLTAEAAAAHLEQIGPVDPGREAKSLDESDHACRRLDLEPLAARERVAAVFGCGSGVGIGRCRSRVWQRRGRDATPLLAPALRCQLLQSALEGRDPGQVLVENEIHPRELGTLLLELRHDRAKLAQPLAVVTPSEQQLVVRPGAIAVGLAAAKPLLLLHPPLRRAAFPPRHPNSDGPFAHRRRIHPVGFGRRRCSAGRSVRREDPGGARGSSRGSGEDRCPE